MGEMGLEGAGKPRHTLGRGRDEGTGTGRAVGGRGQADGKGTKLEGHGFFYGENVRDEIAPSLILVAKIEKVTKKLV